LSFGRIGTAMVMSEIFYCGIMRFCDLLCVRIHSYGGA